METYTLEDILVKCRGNQTAAATLLGINRGTLRSYINNKTDLLITTHDDGTYKVYISVADRKNGIHKKVK